MAAPLISPLQALSGQHDTPDEQSRESHARVEQTTVTRRHGLRINNIGLLLPENSMSEISDDLPLCRLPNTPNWLCGMTNLRGNILPIFDLGMLLNIEREREAQAKQLYARIEDEWVGMVCDGLPERVILESNNKLDILPPLPDTLQPFVFAAYQQEKIWLDWDIKAFFSWVAEQM